MAPLDKLKRRVPFSLAASFAISVPLALLFYRWLVRPLRSVAEAAEKLASGERGIRLKFRGPAELKALADKFNRMAEEMENSTRFLERAVEERTQELMWVINAASELRSSREPFHVLSRTMDLVQDLTGSQAVGGYVWDGGAFRLMASRPADHSTFVLPKTLNPSEEPWRSMVWERGQTVLMPTELAEDGCRPLFCLPLGTQQRVLGMVLFAISGEPSRFKGHTADILSAMAFESALSLENAILYQELKEKVEALEKANRELRSLDETKNNFISMITHELRQPLALISGYAQTIQDYYEELSVEDEMQCIRVILERAEYLSRMVDDLLDLSAMHHGSLRVYPENLDLKALAEQVVARFGSLYPGVRFSVSFPQDYPPVMADSRRMEQVIANLVSNAVKFSDERGEVEIKGWHRGEEVFIEVLDRGRGIDPEKLNRIFDPFFQEDYSIRRPYPGVGMGLHVCQRLIMAHGGRIWAENRKEGGARFVFALPRRKMGDHGAAKEGR